jgi:hypothetical protein
MFPALANQHTNTISGWTDRITLSIPICDYTPYQNRFGLNLNYMCVEPVLIGFINDHATWYLNGIQKSITLNRLNDNITQFGGFEPNMNYILVFIPLVNGTDPLDAPPNTRCTLELVLDVPNALPDGHPFHQKITWFFKTNASGGFVTEPPIPVAFQEGDTYCGIPWGVEVLRVTYDSIFGVTRLFKADGYGNEVEV